MFSPLALTPLADGDVVGIDGTCPESFVTPGSECTYSGLPMATAGLAFGVRS